MTFEPLETLISHCSTTHRLMRDGFAIATFWPNRRQPFPYRIMEGLRFYRATIETDDGH